MTYTIPLPDMGQRWLNKAKSSFLTEPSAMLVFEHSGAVGSQRVPDMLALAEAQSHANGDPVVLRKRLMHVLVEAVDNLSRHAMGIMNEASFALLVRDNDGYRLATGNAVPFATGLLLAHRIEILNLMAQEDLKEHYMKLLAGDARSSNGGAGLGLLTLARKSAAPLVVNSDTLGPFTSYFTLEIRVGREDESYSSGAMHAR